MKYWKIVITMVGEFITVTMVMMLGLSADQVIMIVTYENRVKLLLLTHAALVHPPVMNLTVTSIAHTNVTLSWNVSSYDVLA